MISPRNTVLIIQIIPDEMGTTPLIQAVKAGHVDAVSVLLERGLST